MLWLERWQALCSKAAGSHVYSRLEERSSLCDSASVRGGQGLGPGCSLGCMFAEPVRVEDPNDPEVILRDLPERERADFLSWVANPGQTIYHSIT